MTVGAHERWAMRSLWWLPATLVVACGGGGGGGSTAPGGAGFPGPTLVFTGTTFPSPTDRQALFTVAEDGTHVTQLTTDGRNRFLPHFSPDGATLLYTTYLRGGYGSPDAATDVAVYDRASGRETQLTHTGVATQPVWSPGGQQIAFGTLAGNGLFVMTADGSGVRPVAQPSGAADDLRWGDYLWSRDNWIYFTVAENVGGCFKVRIDRMRPDGSARVAITDGGPHCTPAGLEQSGDADPGISPDGTTLYSSRGLPVAVPGNAAMTVRHLYRFSSAPFTPGKVETDLSLPAKADCIAGVPKVSASGDRVALFLFCASDPTRAGITLTTPSGATYTFVAPGFAPDWNPTVP